MDLGPGKQPGLHHQTRSLARAAADNQGLSQNRAEAVFLAGLLRRNITRESLFGYQICFFDYHTFATLFEELYLEDNRTWPGSRCSSKTFA